MYSLDIRPSLQKKLAKLGRKNSLQAKMILKKSKKIIQNPHHFKNLRSPLQHLKRVHIDKHFVLVFSVNESEKLITLENFDHHDKIYR
ncbi:MAG: YafQ family addiction module toxin component [Patescibacteria group bacterium]|jgi:YafQ family addiction module toxin component